MTAIIKREFPTDATIVINIEDEAVKKDKYVGGVTVAFSHVSSLCMRDIFCSQAVPPVGQVDSSVGMTKSFGGN